MPKKGPRNNGGLSWIKKAEPKFIRDFKERIAYKEQASVDTKKKKLDTDINTELDDDIPQIVQLKSGDLGEKEYLELKSKQEIENAAASSGKILFKKPQKKGVESSATTSVDDEANKSESKKRTEIDLIFNLNEDGVEKVEEPITEGQDDTNKQEVAKKKFLDDEDKEAGQYGLQQPPVKKRFIDGPTAKVTTLSAAKVLAREAKAGNKKMLSFYDEEEEEIEEFNRQTTKEKELDDEDEDSDN